MGKFDNILLVSDFDGTLIDREGRISAENILAIRSFVAAGGCFSGATGRSESNVRPYADALPFNAPWILYNGAAIYDWEKETFICRDILDHPQLKNFIRQVIGHLPRINVQIYPGGAFCQVNPKAFADVVAVREGQACIETVFDDVPGRWLKVLFCSDDPDQISTVEALFDASSLTGAIHKMRSGRRYFELTAMGVNKGAALERLKRMMTPRPRCVIAIGDYRNDIEMLIAADIAATPQNALPEVKAHAQMVTRSNSEHALADLIAQMETMFD